MSEKERFDTDLDTNKDGSLDENEVNYLHHIIHHNSVRHNVSLLISITVTKKLIDGERDILILGLS